MPLPGVRNTLAWFKSKGIIKVIAEDHKTYTYAFAVKSSQKTDAAEADRGERFITLLHELGQSDDEKVRVFAAVFQRYYEQGKTTFTTAELSAESGLKNYEVHNGLRPFRVKGVIENINTTGVHGYYRLLTDLPEETDTPLEQATGYSDEVLNLISQLADSKAVYAARTATAARSICPPSPVTAHGHCPAENESMCVYAGLVTALLPE